jgi:hypothetical protein
MELKHAVPISVRCTKCETMKDPVQDRCKKIKDHTWICAKCDESTHSRRTK